MATEDAAAAAKDASAEIAAAGGDVAAMWRCFAEENSAVAATSWGAGNGAGADVVFRARLLVDFLTRGSLRLEGTRDFVVTAAVRRRESGCS